MVSDSNEALVLLRSEDKEKRAAAAAYLGGLGEEGIRLAVPFLSDSDWHLRYRACEIIGFTGSPAGEIYLLPMLNDAKDHVRYMAVKSLGLCKVPDLREKVTPMLNDENHFVVRITKEVLAKAP